MKTYLIFIYINDSEKSSIKGFQSMHFPFNWEYDKESDSWFGLYAWTHDKSIFKKAKKQRSKRHFKFKEADLEDFKEIESKYGNLELKKRLYVTGPKGEEEEIISSGFEYEVATDESIVMELFLKDSLLVDPMLFSKKLYNTLESLGYSYLFFNYSNLLLEEVDEDEEELGDDFPSESDCSLHDRIEIFWDSLSYKDINTNTYRNERGTCSHIPTLNEFNAFIYLFGDLFV